jgi:hypothetical protein
VIGDALCTILGLIMLMDIVQKRTLKSYFSRCAFSIKTCELCEFCTGYLLNSTVYTGAGTDITTGTDVLQSSKIVVRLLDPLINVATLCGRAIITFHHSCVVYLETMESVLQVHSV